MGFEPPLALSFLGPPGSSPILLGQEIRLQPSRTLSPDAPLTTSTGPLLKALWSYLNLSSSALTSICDLFAALLYGSLNGGAPRHCVLAASTIALMGGLLLLLPVDGSSSTSTASISAVPLLLPPCKPSEHSHSLSNALAGR